MFFYKRACRYTRTGIYIYIGVTGNIPGHINNSENTFLLTVISINLLKIEAGIQLIQVGGK